MSYLPTLAVIFSTGFMPAPAWMTRDDVVDIHTAQTCIHDLNPAAVYAVVTSHVYVLCCVKI